MRAESVERMIVAAVGVIAAALVGSIILAAVEAWEPVTAALARIP